MGLLDDIRPGQAEMGNSTRNGFFPCIEAEYTVRIELCKLIDSEKSGSAFIAELEVLEAKGDSEELPEVGAFRDWYRGLDVTGTARKMAQKDMLTFLSAAMGFDPDVTADRERFFEAHKNGAQLMKDAGDKNALDGAVLKLKTYGKKIKKSGGDFTVHCWKPGAPPPAKSEAPAAPPPPAAPAADPYAGMPRAEGRDDLAWNGTAWIVMATGLPA